MSDHQPDPQKGSQDWVRTIEEGNGYGAIEPDSYLKLLRNIEGYSFFRALQKHVKPEDRVLEAGCGWAFSSFALAAQHIQVIALDISGKLIADLVTLKRKLGEPYDKFLSPLEGDIFNLDSIAEKQDVIFSDGTYEHFTKDERTVFLRNIRAALKNGGTFMVQVPNMGNPFFGSVVGDKMPALFLFTIKSLSSELCAAGFQVYERGYSFVNPGFEQWVESTWMIPPIHLANFLFRFLPTWAKRIFCAHFYCVAVVQKIKK